MTAEVMLTVLWLGFFAAGATALIRILPLVAPLVERAVKPWACDFCMCFWLVLLGCSCTPFVAAWLHYKVSMSVFWLAGPAAYAVALFVLRRLTDPVGPPPVFGTGGIPELKDPEENKILLSFTEPPPPH